MTDGLHEPVRRAAAQLQVWAYPLIFAQRLRLNFTQPGDPLGQRPEFSAGAPPGRFGHARVLSDPGLRVGVAPNVDTLYSVAWLDLARGPHVVRLPAVSERYFSLQVAKSDTSSPLVISARTHPGDLPHVVVERGAPDVDARPDVVRVSTRDRWLMLVGRTGVDAQDRDDLLRARTVQDDLQVSCPGSGSYLGTVDPGDAVDIELANVAREQEILEPAALAAALLRVLATAGESAEGEGIGALLDAVRISELARGQAPAAVVGAVARGLRDGLESIEAHVRTLGRSAHGWATNEMVSSFGDDYLRRAAVAHSQIFVNPPEEATYPVCEVDSEGRPLDGSAGSYRVTFAPGTPPANAFWSLTMYHAAGNLVSNELSRYAIGDRTRGLEWSPDGSLTIDIGARRPERGPANWLPAPPGAFRLMLRLYWPSDRSWQPPPVIRTVAP